MSLQKLAVRTCPVGSTKPLSLIKPSGQGIAISVVPAKTPVSMVTAHLNGQKAVSSEPLQTSPVNLQMGGRAAVTTPILPLSNRRSAELPTTQVSAMTSHPDHLQHHLESVQRHGHMVWGRSLIANLSHLFSDSPGSSVC